MAPAVAHDAFMMHIKEQGGMVKHVFGPTPDLARKAEEADDAREKRPHTPST